jgi:hypothetical protein
MRGCLYINGTVGSWEVGSFSDWINCSTLYEGVRGQGMLDMPGGVGPMVQVDLLVQSTDSLMKKAVGNGM